MKSIPITSSRPAAGGLPAHWRRRRMLAAAAISLLVLGSTFVASSFGSVEQTDQAWLRARFSAREWLPPSTAPDPDIVLVEMDDRSTDQWPEPIIAWGPHFADALDRLVDGGARVIAMDWIQPISTTKWFPGHDAKLSQALAGAGNVVLVKESRKLPGAAAKWIVPTPELLYALPDSPLNPDAHLGYAELSGQDSVIITMAPALPGEKNAIGFAARTVERYYGIPAKTENARWTIPGKTSVPLRADGSMPVNYANHSGSPRAFRRYSISDIARRPRGKNQDFAGKIVVIGATYTGSNDNHFVPFFSGMDPFRPRNIAGMEVQANMMRTLLHGRALAEPGTTLTWLFSLALSLMGLIAFSLLPWGRAALVTLAAALGWLLLSLALFVTRDYLLPATLPLLSLAFSGALMGAYRALGEERERAQVMKVWGRYHDPRVVEYALQNPEMRGGEGREVPATVLFADLKNFTKTVESLAPAEALQQLNRYLALISQAVLEHGGLVDKYLGDGLMAQWGVPQAQENHELAAVQACLQLEQRVRDLRAAEGAGDIGFGIRLTLHTGPVVAGNVGSEGRLEYTIIGDTVNVTSRLQETAKELDCEFLISESTYAAVKDYVLTGKEAEVMIRGRQQPLRVYEILGQRGENGQADATAISESPGRNNV